MALSEKTANMLLAEHMAFEFVAQCSEEELRGVALGTHELVTSATDNADGTTTITASVVEKP